LHNYCCAMVRSISLGDTPLRRYELSTASENEADRDLTAAILKQWSDIAENQKVAISRHSAY
jgi:hypothetical protein